MFISRTEKTTEKYKNKTFFFCGASLEKVSRELLTCLLNVYFKNRKGITEKNNKTFLWLVRFSQVIITSRLQYGVKEKNNEN